jgi:hypothetical protein
LTAAVLTLAVLAGACAGYARVEFAWAASQLEVTRLDENAEPTARLPEVALPWPDRAQRFMVVGLLLLAVAGLLLIGLAWQIAL